MKMKNLETKLDFDKILALDKFFESENKSEVQKDIDTLRRSFSKLDDAFDMLISNCLLVQLSESTTDTEGGDIDIEEAYKQFFDEFKKTVNLFIGFYKKYKTNNAFDDYGLHLSLEKKFLNAKDSYNTLIVNGNSKKNRNFDKMVKHVNDAYFAYIYLLHGYNSMIDAYNKGHPDSLIKLISGIPDTKSLGHFCDSDISIFVESFVSSIKQLEC